MRLGRNLLYSDSERGVTAIHTERHVACRGRHKGRQEAEDKSAGSDIYWGFPGKDKNQQFRIG